MSATPGMPMYCGFLPEDADEPPIGTCLEGGGAGPGAGDRISFTRVAEGTDSDWSEIINTGRPTRVGWPTVQFWLPLRIVERPAGVAR